MMRNSLQGATERTSSALQLIERSERSAEIVQAQWSEVVEAGMFAECEGTTDRGRVVEFWGSSHNEATHPGGWRVHLHRPEVPDAAAP